MATILYYKVYILVYKSFTLLLLLHSRIIHDKFESELLVKSSETLYVQGLYEFIYIDTRDIIAAA